PVGTRNARAGVRRVSVPGWRRPIPQATGLPVRWRAPDALARRAARERIAGTPSAALEPRHAAVLLCAILLVAGYAQAQAAAARPRVFHTLTQRNAPAA